VSAIMDTLARDSLNNDSPTLSEDSLLSPNLPLHNIKNMRDLASAYERIVPNLVFRTGCVSKASPEDVSAYQTTVVIYYQIASYYTGYIVDSSTAAK
jgi:hypothetical protein